MSFNFNTNQSIFTQNNIAGKANNLGNLPKTNFNAPTGVSIFTTNQNQANNLSTTRNTLSATNTNLMNSNNIAKTPQNAQNSGGGIFSSLKNMFGANNQKGNVVANAQLVLSRAQSLTGSVAAQELLNKNNNEENSNGEQKKGLNIDIA